MKGRYVHNHQSRKSGQDYLGQTQVGRIIHGTRWSDIVGELKTQSKPKFKITADQVVEIRNRCSNGESQTSVAKDYGIRACSVNSIVSRRKWKSIP